MAVSHFVKIDAAVDDVAVVRQIGGGYLLEPEYGSSRRLRSNNRGASVVSLTADVIGRVAEDGTGLNVVKALKIHRGSMVTGNALLVSFIQSASAETVRIGLPSAAEERLYSTSMLPRHRRRSYILPGSRTPRCRSRL